MKRALSDWFAARSWKPFKFQREVWKAIGEGRSGLLHATTGAGKTYAVWLGALQAFAPETRSKKSPQLTVLWLTPMRALAADTLRALQQPLETLQPTWSAGARSGDTGSAQRSAQDQHLPTVLVTTPESLSLLLARADAQEVLGSLRMVVVDEWHELLGNKRGVQVQLALARLRRWNAGLCVWGMSATLGNLQDAMRTLLGGDEGVLVQGEVPKELLIDSLLPGRAERFPWGGHLGLTMLPQVIEEIAASSTTLVFTNTRSQSEIWYQAMLEARPDWAGQIALHHGSLDRAVREWVELGLKSGELKAVVCTSSLDLGVDFLPVERVLQIGSPKGVARLLQRAGRSGHGPGRPSRITLVPTHSIEMVEGAAARAAIAAGHIEARSSPLQPLDVLVQHLVTVALGGGFVPDALYDEVRSTTAYAGLSCESWQWCLDFVAQGGSSLAAYPDYRRVVPDAEGVWRVPDARLARRHRMNIGTIVSEASMAVQYLGGARIGSVEEGFVARMKPGECFLFGGRLLELVRIHDMTAWVRRASGKRAAVPRWSGGRMPVSTTLADAVVRQLALAGAGCYDTPELQCLRPLLEIQQQWSALPTPETLLAELLKTREGWHLFVYPFAGRHVHLGLANLVAWRVAQHQPRTFSIAVNDYGFELLCAQEIDWPALLPQVLALGDALQLLHEVLASLNASELAQRRFREIARVSGLIFQGYPGEKRSNKQLQASSSLFYEVFRKYDPANRLLLQAEEELLAQELEIGRLRASLIRMTAQRLVVQTLERPTPFSFPLMVELFREKLSNERLADRIARMVAQLEQAAGGAPGAAGVERVRDTLVFGGEGGRENKKVSEGGKGMSDKLQSVPPADATACQVEWAGQDLRLLADRALWWPAQGVLFIADLHIGKAASYRALGQPVPSGTTQLNLARLDRLIETHRPLQIVFLGDFLHAAQACTPQVLAALEAWRERHPQLALTLVRGNHDSHAGDPPASLGIAVVDEPHLIGPFAACHHPQAHATHFVLAGHLHPACTLYGRGRDRVRMPCFVREGEQAILPAFGEFTGGWQVEAAPGRRFYGVGGDAVWALPA